MTVSVAHVLAGAAAHAVPLTAECVGYLVLGAADQVASAPRSLGAEDLVLSDDGVVRVMGGRAARAEEAERDLRSVLDALLFCASSASPGLLRASRRPPGVGLEALVRELETALIPVNRSAAKRALARLQRETLRALETGRIRPDSAPPTAPATERQVIAAPESVASAPAAPPVAPATAHAEPATSVAGPEPLGELEGSSREPLVTPSVHTAVTTVPPAMTVRPPHVSIPPAPRLPSSLAHATLDVAPSAAPAARCEAANACSGAAVERTVVLAQVAPRPTNPERAVPESQLVETRPEPVVRRASARPPAPAPEPPGVVGGTQPLPPVVLRPAEFQAVAATNESSLGANSAALSVTPLLGTLVREEAATEVLVPGAVAARDTLPSPAVDHVQAAYDAELEALPEIVEDDILVDDDVRAGVGDDLLVDDDVRARVEDDILVQDVEAPAADVLAAPEEPASEVDEFDIVVLDPRGFVASSDETSVPIAVVAPLPPAAAAVQVPEVASAPPTDLVEIAAVDAQSAAPELPCAAETTDVDDSVAADETTLDAPAEPVELAVLVESALPPWVRDPVPAVELTPPPRIARPEPRPSDVEALLSRLDEVPLPEEDVGAKLRRLAGLDPTPPPSTKQSER